MSDRARPRVASVARASERGAQTIDVRACARGDDAVARARFAERAIDRARAPRWRVARARERGGVGERDDADAVPDRALWTRRHGTELGVERGGEGV